MLLADVEITGRKGSRNFLSLIRKSIDLRTNFCVICILGSMGVDSIFIVLYVHL
nr:MAG TPA: hypothetical protein [Caudoviricetes sp.]